MSADKKIAAGKFKAQCLKLMDEVNKKKFELVITKRGKPIAKLVSLEENRHASNFGCMRGTAEIVEHLISTIEMPDLLNDPAYQAAIQIPPASPPPPAPVQQAAPPPPVATTVSAEPVINTEASASPPQTISVPPEPEYSAPPVAQSPSQNNEAPQVPEPSFNEKWTPQRVAIYKGNRGGENSW